MGWQSRYGRAHKEREGKERGRVADVIIPFKFYRNRLRGFRGVRGQNGGLPLTLTVAHTAACDLVPLKIVILYLKSPTQNPDFIRKIPRFLAQD